MMCLSYFHGLLSCSDAVWAAVDPSGHDTADDQQLSEGQRHSAHTGLSLLRVTETPVHVNTH